LEQLLTRIENGEPMLIVGLDNKDIPTIHNFYQKKYYESIQHYGFGEFHGKTEHGTFTFFGGGAMDDYHWEDNETPNWIAWCPLYFSNRTVLQDLGYDCQKTAGVLKEVISKLSE
jgi:hypothetical protein